jgi:hypothetical protein
MTTEPRTDRRELRDGRTSALLRAGARRLGAVLVVLAMGACSSDAQEPTSDLVISSDPELRALASEILPGLAARASMELVAPVRIERRSRSELVAYLGHKLDEELPADEARATVRVYAMLGLVDPDLDLRGLLLDLYTEQVAGFYEPDSTALFVMEDQPREALESLLLHELVHAVQDQTADLDVLTSGDLGNDRAAAAHAAVEGHATLVMLEFMMERMTGQAVDLASVPGIADQLLPAVDGMQAQFPALAGAPLVIRRSLLFPYVQGAGFVQELWATEGRVAPFGEWLPASTEQVIDGRLDDPPLDVRIDVQGGDVLHEDVLGRLELQVLVETHVSADAGGLAEGWGGDRYALVEPATGGDAALVWVSVWDDQQARDRFVEGFGGATDRLGPNAMLRPATVDGRPGAVLTIGSVDGLDVTFRIGTSDR